MAHAGPRVPALRRRDHADRGIRAALRGHGVVSHAHEARRAIVEKLPPGRAVHPVPRVGESCGWDYMQCHVLRLVVLQQLHATPVC